MTPEEIDTFKKTVVQMSVEMKISSSLEKGDFLPFLFWVVPAGSFTPESTETVIKLSDPTVVNSDAKYNTNVIAIPGFETPGLAEVVNQVKDVIGVPLLLGFTSDAFFKEFDTKSDDDDILSEALPDENYEKGQFQREFKEGNMSVKEALVITVATLDEMAVAIFPYSIDDTGSIVFTEDVENPEFTPSDQGNIPVALTKAFL